MRAKGLIGVAVLTCGLGGCHPKPLSQAFQVGTDGRPMRVVASLDCPESIDRLTRTAQDASGTSCTYRGPGEEQVSLRLLPLAGATASGGLATLDGQLRAELPGAAGGSVDGGVHVSAGANGDRANIDVPGFHLKADGNAASIRLPGVTIDANGNDAHVATGFAGSGGSVVNARNGGVEVRTGGVGPNGVAATYLLAADTPGPSGDRAVGYVAKGPAAGPLVVASFQSRGGDHHGDGLRGLDRLVDLNVHGS